ncbi:MAG: MFS transporter [Promethearchaeota archaeon]|nr:MAG: MFS transporter [Candidatus Lokiarchaeota archaeon]
MQVLLMSHTPIPSESTSASTPSYMKQFFLLWTGQILSLLGSEVVGFAITWYITDTTKSVLYLSLMMLLTFVPRLLLAPIAGAWADKHNRKIILAISDALQAFSTIVLIGLIAFAPMNIWIIIGFNTLRAVFQAIHGPAYMAVMPQMVPKSKLSNVNGLNQLFQSLTGLAAPVLGALLYGAYGLGRTLWIDVITFVIAFSLLLMTKIPPLPQAVKKSLSVDSASLSKDGQTEDPQKESLMDSIKVGIKTIRNIPGLLALITIMAMANLLLTPFNTLTPYIINVVHSGTEKDIALLSVGFQLGLILGSIAVSLKKEWKRKTLMVTFGLASVWLGTILFALAPQGNFTWLVVSGFIITFLLPIATTLIITMFQSSIPLEKMGRVSSLFSMLNSAGMLIGYMVSGPLANLLGITELIIGAGIIGLVFTLYMFFFSGMKHMNHIEEEAGSDSKRDIEFSEILHQTHSESSENAVV